MADYQITESSRSYQITESSGSYQVTINTEDQVITKSVFIQGVDLTVVDAYFRIPIISLSNNNTLIVGAEARRGGSGDYRMSDFYIKRSVNYGRTWTAPELVIANNGVYTNPVHGSRVLNPTIIIDGTRIWLFHTKLDDETAISYYGSILGAAQDFYPYFGYIYSDDNGVTWSAFTNLNALFSAETNAFFAGPGNGIVMDNGTIVVPFCDYRHSDVWWEWDPLETDRGIRAGIIYSTDNGANWQKSTTVLHFTDESAIIEDQQTPGRLVLYSRGAGNKLWVHYTDDMGATWIAHATNQLITGINTQVSVWKYKYNGVTRYLLSMPEDLVSRKNITVRKSSDLLIWDHVYTLSEGIAAGYTGICSNSEGRLFCTLEQNAGIIDYFDLSNMKNSIIT